MRIAERTPSGCTDAGLRRNATRPDGAPTTQTCAHGAGAGAVCPRNASGRPWPAYTQPPSVQFRKGLCNEAERWAIVERRGQWVRPCALSEVAWPSLSSGPAPTTRPPPGLEPGACGSGAARYDGRATCTRTRRSDRPEEWLLLFAVRGRGRHVRASWAGTVVRRGRTSSGGRGVGPTRTDGQDPWPRGAPPSLRRRRPTAVVRSPRPRGFGCALGLPPNSAKRHGPQNPTAP